MRSPSAGTLGRLACCAPLLFLIVACAKIVDLEDSQSPEQTADSAKATPSSTPSSSSSSSSSGNPSTTDTPQSTSSSSSGGGGGGDASTDSGTPEPVCPPGKRPNEDSCDQPSQCCSGKCNSANRCANSCKKDAFDGFCNPFGSDCCVRTFCTTSGQCTPCIPGGGNPYAGRADSCCSKKIDEGKCEDEDS